MDKADAIRKVKAMRNTNGRTPGEIESFKAMAAKMMEAHGITEADLVTRVYSFDDFDFNYRTGAAEQRTADEAEWIRKAREAQFWADQAKRNSRSSYSPPPRSSRSRTRRTANRDPFTGSVPNWAQHPDEWTAFMHEMGFTTKGELARACGVSSSLVSEWFGKGRGKFASKVQANWYMTKVRKDMGR